MRPGIYAYKAPSNISEHQDKNDSIFKGITERGTDTTPYHDHDYKDPDYKMYVFNTTIHPITYIDNKSKLLKLARHKPMGTDGGVYIVEYNHIHTGDKHASAKLLKHYNSILEHSEFTKQALLKLTNNERDVTLRTIRYIPYDILRSELTVYESNTKLTFILGDMPNINETYRLVEDNTGEVSKTDSSVLIKIDIIDNESSSPYYLKIGRQKIKILPRKDLDMTSSTDIIISRLDSDYKDITKIFPSSYQDYGIYNCPKLADSDGDLKAKIEITKLGIEEEKLKQAKLDSEVSMAKYKKELEIEKIKFNHILLEWKKEGIIRNEKRAMEVFQALYALHITDKKFEHEVFIENKKVDHSDRKQAVDFATVAASFIKKIM